ncbi:MAG: hypothetical protein ACJASC_003450 [Limimaricola cinnabarinus]
MQTLGQPHPENCIANIDESIQTRNTGKNNHIQSMQVFQHFEHLSSPEIRPKKLMKACYRNHYRRLDFKNHFFTNNASLQTFQQTCVVKLLE